MGPTDLIALTTLEIAGWLPPRERDSPDTPQAAHQRLVDVCRTFATRSRSTPRAAGSLLSSLIAEINASSLAVTLRVPSAISSARQTGAKYLMEFDTLGGDIIRERYTFAELPFIGQAEIAFSWMSRLRELTPHSQLLVMQCLELECDRMNSAVHLKFAEEDGDLLQIDDLREEVRNLEQQVVELHSRMGANDFSIKDEIQDAMSAHEVQQCRAVVEASPAAKPAEFREIAVWMEAAGESLIQPLPIANRTKQAAFSSATLAWKQVHDLSDTLHVLAIWLRALGSPSQSPTCSLCYRHLGKRGKLFCTAHQRVRGKRQPAREFHIASRFPIELKALTTNEAGLKAAINSAGVPAEPKLDESSTKLPAGLEIHDAMIQPAAVLHDALQRASPVFGIELQRQIDSLFEEVIKVASAPFLKTLTVDRRDVTAKAVRQAQARRWLTWNTFFTAWYANVYSKPWPSEAMLAGRGFDIDHPIVLLDPVQPGAIVFDLLRQRAWMRAEHYTDTEAYVSVRKMQDLRRAGLSQRAIGRQLGISHETVRQTLAHADNPDVESAARRLRILTKANR